MKPIFKFNGQLLKKYLSQNYAFGIILIEIKFLTKGAVQNFKNVFTGYFTGENSYETLEGNNSSTR